VIRHVATFLPFHRIQQVDIERGPLDRAFGLSTLIIRSAAASTDAKVPGLDPSVVEDLRQSLLERADLDDAV
jgi:membrane protein YdbS with pleckstrin-like domain